MYRHVTPFLKSINTSLSNRSLRDGTIIQVYFQNSSFEGIYRCFGKYILTTYHAYHLILQLLIVSSIYVSPHEQINNTT